MPHTGTLVVTKPSDTEIAMRRVFDVPPALAFDAFTKPAILKQWLGVRAGWMMSVCEVDLRAGGTYRWMWRGPNGEIGVRGTYHEVVAGERVIATERFDQPWYPGEGRVTIEFADQGAATAVTMTVRYISRQARDDVFETGMTRGIVESYDRLDKVLATVAQAA